MEEKNKNKHKLPFEQPEELAGDEADIPPPPPPLSGSAEKKVRDYLPGAMRPPEQIAPLNVPLHPVFIARGQEALAALEAASPDAGADERILHRLVADEVAVASALLEAQSQLAARLTLLIDDHKRMAGISKVLRDVVLVTNSISKRVEGALGVAANLRAQRRFLANHGRRTGDGS
jgi:hypothetical protein